MEKIDPLRKRIRELDILLLKTLEDRFQTVQQIWKIKKQWGIPMRDKDKESMVVDELKQNSRLRPELIDKLCDLIFQENDALEFSLSQ